MNVPFSVSHQRQQDALEALMRLKAGGDPPTIMNNPNPPVSKPLLSNTDVTVNLPEVNHSGFDSSNSALPAPLAEIGIGDRSYMIRKRRVVIGRQSGHHVPDIGLGHNSFVSRQHLVLSLRDDGCTWMLTCRGKNGVFVDGTFDAGKSISGLDLPPICTLRLPSTNIELRLRSLIQPQSAMPSTAAGSSAASAPVRLDVKRPSSPKDTRPRATSCVGQVEAVLRRRLEINALLVRRCQSAPGLTSARTGNFEAAMELADLRRRSMSFSTSCPSTPKVPHQPSIDLSIDRLALSRPVPYFRDRRLACPSSVADDDCYAARSEAECVSSIQEVDEDVEEPEKVLSTSRSSSTHPPKLSPIESGTLQFQLQSSYCAASNIDYATTPTKPPFSYAQLIIQAIMNAPNERLTLSGIYAYIVKNYKFYRSTDKGWQNSIRHNLSLNRFFIKKAREHCEWGKGSFWCLEDDSKPRLYEMAYKERRNRKSTTKASTTNADDVASTSGSCSARQGSIGKGSQTPSASSGLPRPLASLPHGNAVVSVSPSAYSLGSSYAQCVSPRVSVPPGYILLPSGHGRDGLPVVVPNVPVISPESLTSSFVNATAQYASSARLNSHFKPLDPADSLCFCDDPIDDNNLPIGASASAMPGVRSLRLPIVSEVQTAPVLSRNPTSPILHGSSLHHGLPANHSSPILHALQHGATSPMSPARRGHVHRQFTFSPTCMEVAELQAGAKTLADDITSQSAPCSPRTASRISSGWIDNCDIMSPDRVHHYSGSNPFSVKTNRKDGRQRLQLCHSPPAIVSVPRAGTSALRAIREAASSSNSSEGQPVATTRKRTASKSLSATPVRELDTKAQQPAGFLGTVPPDSMPGASSVSNVNQVMIKVEPESVQTTASVVSLQPPANDAMAAQQIANAMQALDVQHKLRILEQQQDLLKRQLQDLMSGAGNPSGPSSSSNATLDVPRKAARHE